MADFQDELLALAGIDDSDVASNRKRAHDDLDDVLSSSSDEDNNENVGQDYAEESGGEGNEKSEDEFEEKFKNPYRLEGKFKDEADRAKIMAMTEIERESILFEREEEISKLMERRELAIRLHQQNAQYMAQSTRRSTRDKPLTSAAAGKRDKLTELKKRRQERSARSVSERTRKRSPVSDYEEQNESEKSEEEEGYSPSYAEEKVEQVSKDNASANLYDLNAIRLGRKHVSEYMYHPIFESTVTGCFVRVKIGERDGQGVYRLCQVKGILESRKPYRVDGVLTKVSLECFHGRSKRVFDVNVLSNEPFSDHDFQRWHHQMMEDKLSMPSKNFVQRKLNDLRDMSKYVLSEKEVSDIINRKKELSRVPSNIAAEKTRLRQRRQAAYVAGNAELVKEIDDQLNTLEELSMGSNQNSNSAMDQLAKVNERNRRRNHTEIRLAEQRMNEERRRLSAAATATPMSAPTSVLTGTSPQPSPSLSTSIMSTPKLNPSESVVVASEKASSPDLSPKLLPSESQIFDEGIAVTQTPNTLEDKDFKLHEKAVHGIDDIIATVDFGIDINI
ncbi:RNA polymerase II associated Paf1 complex [Schizosaccharomyces pombe]